MHILYNRTHIQTSADIISVLTIIANNIKRCPNKPQSKFALYHLTECVVNEVSTEQLSINNKKSKISEQCGFASVYVSCNVTFRLECAPRENEWACCTAAYSVRLHGGPNTHTHTISMRYMPKIHFNNNSNFSLTHYQEHTHKRKRKHMHTIHIIPKKRMHTHIF